MSAFSLAVLKQHKVRMAQLIEILYPGGLECHVLIRISFAVPANPRGCKATSGNRQHEIDALQSPTRIVLHSIIEGDGSRCCQPTKAMVVR